MKFCAKITAVCWLLASPLIAGEAVDSKPTPPGETQIERGYRLLTTKAYLPADFDQEVFDELWKCWEEPLRSQAEKASPDERRKKPILVANLDISENLPVVARDRGFQRTQGRLVACGRPGTQTGFLAFGFPPPQSQTVSRSRTHRGGATKSRTSFCVPLARIALVDSVLGGVTRRSGLRPRASRSGAPSP